MTARTASARISSGCPAPAGRINTDIEILRAFAIIITVVGHISSHFEIAGTPLRASMDVVSYWFGVDLFFCISGYVICMSLMRQLPEGGLTGGNYARVAVPFYIRRVFRILPTAWLWLGVVALLAAAMPQVEGKSFFGNRKEVYDGVLASLLFVQNISLWVKQHFEPMTDIYWSLSLEEQFYFVFPLVLLALPRRPLLWALGAAAAVQIFTPRPMWSFWWAVRSDGLILGVMLALCQGGNLHARFAPLFMENGAVRVGAALLLVLLSGMAAHGGWFPLGVGVLTVCSFALVWIASYDRGWILSRNPAVRRALVYVGQRSYGIYIIHQPAFALTKYLCAAPFKELVARMPSQAASWLTPTVFLLLLFVLVELNFVLLETPLRRFGVALARRRAGQAQEAPPKGFLAACYEAVDPAALRRPLAGVAVLALVLGGGLGGLKLTDAVREEWTRRKIERALTDVSFDLFTLPEYLKNHVKTAGFSFVEKDGRTGEPFVWLEGPEAIFAFISNQEKLVTLELGLVNVIEGQGVTVDVNGQKTVRLDFSAGQGGNRVQLEPLVFTVRPGLNQVIITPRLWNGNGATLGEGEKRTLAVMASRFRLTPAVVQTQGQAQGQNQGQNRGGGG
ncbi:acyltransferase family protein [Fundidesulfovibrio soli]|uniref:acyltransferase family protein n=1 Tax=Fundidesulfovibrio soli TaxID=2922716 RepID=UPI001FAF794B|nr:acyltransferase [Fundidesulfovibrio soli]